MPEVSNFRVVTSNLVDTSDLESSPAVGGLVVDNLKSDMKNLVFRVAGTSSSITASWVDDQTVSVVAIPACNLTNTATVTITLLLSTGGPYSVTVPACPGSLNTGGPVTVNDFSYGYSSKVVVWLPMFTNVRSVVIDIDDPDNSAGVIDCSRLVIGNYWAPNFGAGYSTEYQVEDLSQNTRTESGALISNRQPVIERMTIMLNTLDPSDRRQLLEITRRFGTYRNILVAVLPDDPDSVIRHSSVLYGKRHNSPIRFETYQVYSSQLILESW